MDSKFWYEGRELGRLWGFQQDLAVPKKEQKGEEEG